MAKTPNKHDKEEDDVPYNDEEDEEDEDYDDDDDSRTKKRKFNPFIDEMAIVNDEEDEEEEDEEYGREDGFIEEDVEELDSTSKITSRRHIELDRRRRELEDMDDEQVAAFYVEKYGPQPSALRNIEEVPQQLLHPNPGKEKDIIFGLMKRYFDRTRGAHPLDTFSAFSRESLKGYIYIEAKRQAHVQEALNNIPHIYMTTLMLVPLKDMVDAINVQKKEVEIPLGGWVRIKRGTYAGDLAQVIEVSDTQDSARVKVVPRLDLENAAASNDDDSKKRKKTARPPPRLFNPERLPSRSISSLQKKGPYWVYDGNYFRDGYLEKSMKVTVLQIEDVNPTLDEIARFAGNDINGEDGERAIDLSALSSLTINNAQANGAIFQPGDTVSVVEGDMIHSTGTVENVIDSSVVVSLAVDGIKKRVTLPAKQLRKKFKEGDHVKVINGRYKDESGMVVRVEDNIVTLLSDATLKEVKVFAKDLREAAEVMFGKTVIGNYELHDLVQLDFYTVGVIVQVDRDTFKVLTQNGELRTVEPHQITNKRDSKKAIATDANGNSIRSGDSVIEISGEKRNCSILHLYRNLVFLHSREHSENYGVWVSNTRSVVSTSARGRQNASLDTQKSFATPAPFNRDMRGGARGGRGGPARGGFYGRGRGGRDNLVAKTVRIAQGPHKGYIGIVKDTTDDSARVELHTNSKIISVEKSKLIILDSQGNPIGQPTQAPFDNAVSNNNGFARPIATPSRYGEGAQTPMRNAAGARTPAWNSGSKTPAWNSGARTPNPYANDGGRTPAWDSGSKTPMWRSDAWGSSSSISASNNDKSTMSHSSNTSRYNEPDIPPQTPSNAWIAPTPHYETAPTPGAAFIPPTPAAYMSAPTPAAYGPPTTGNFVPATPAETGLPQTPFMPTGGDYRYIEEMDNEKDWPIEDIEVKFTKDQGSATKGQLGGIVSVDMNSKRCVVNLYSNNEKIDTPFDSIEPMRPNKKENVRIILGEHRGELGNLIGVDAQDGIVRLKGDAAGFKFLNMITVGKYIGTESVV
ncbi:transcription elongation factor Spt5 [Rhizopus microsporus]|uniref:Transcription elongation factor SPT5 n=1 Tax=Rhizopus microsporus TaxID=58291 RepID=A0A1X0RQC5_RHIZD|nr:transcription elongation factor Spt5 [Rhizopus microsporus]